jgi:tetratricopeptide (TPR) repeat protein
MNSEVNAEAALLWVDGLVQAKTGDRLSELQRIILEQVWQGGRYLDIAESYGCTEGHAKDVGSDLWKLLCQVLGERVTKKNLRTVLGQRLLQNARFPQMLHPALDSDSEEYGIARIASVGFVGRSEAIAHLNTLANQGNKLMVIQGEGGIGKTTLAQQYLHQKFKRVLELLMAKETQTVMAAEHIVEEWLKQEFQEEPGLDFGITLERLKRHLRQESVGILIDNLEPALDAHGQFFANQRNYVELLRVLNDPQVKGITLVTSRDRLCEPSLHAQHYKLPGLSLKAWQQYFLHQQIVLHASTLSAMHHAYGGNAKAMGILAGVISTEYDGDMETYWQQSHSDLLHPTDLKNLIHAQLSRLQNHDAQAYRLFCRLGCYRYQVVPTVPLEGIFALLWDVPDSQKRSAVVALQNRSLIESHKGEYSLHPVLKEAAMARFVPTPEHTPERIPEWTLAQTAAAEFWSTSVVAFETAQDALKAFEAYYHYSAIQDFAKAGQVILKSRHNQWRQYLPLGSTLYRMGLIQPLLSAIPAVIDHLQADYALNELHNILGDVYWITGHIQDAIRTQETALELSAVALKTLTDSPENRKSRYSYTMLRVDSRLSIGLYCLDLWELERSADCFEQVMAQTQGTEHERWTEKAAVCLALTQSCLGDREAAHQQADAIYETILRDRPSENRGSFAYFTQLLGQTYVNLSGFEMAQSLFERALSFSEASHYTQVKAKTLTGLAMMQRHRGQYREAIALHQQAVTLLETLGAKCDLAESYYQFGMTCQAVENGQSQTFFQKAIALFEAMNAPRQVEKVKSAKGT